MADQCYVIEDVLFHSELWLLRREAKWSDGAQFAGEWTFARGVVLADTGTFTETIDGRRTLTLREAALASDQFLAGGRPVEKLFDAARAGDRFRITRSVVLADAADFAEQLMPERGAGLHELATFDDAFAPRANPRALIADTLRAGDAWPYARSGVLADAGTFSDSWTVRRGATLAEVGTFADLLAAEARPIVVLREAGVLGEAYSAHASPRGTLADVAWFEDDWLLPPPRTGATTHIASRTGPTRAWVASTDSWGMSRYTDWQLNSLVVIDGVLYGAAADGLHRVAADTDAGAPINAHLTTDRDDFGFDRPHNVHMVYAAAATDGGLQLTADSAPRGTRVFYTYQFEPRPADEDAPQRAKLGRGVRSRYWQLTVGNRAGADLALSSLSYLTDAADRRI